MENSELQKLYANPDQSKGENIKLWEEEELASYKDYTEKLFENLKTYEILPQDMENFVFLSVSSNKADKEKFLAQLLDKSLNGKVFTKKPLIIAADFFGTQDQDDAMSQTFTPGFKTNEKLKLSNVNFSYLSADAYHIPLDDESVSIIFDRLGVLHHSTDSFTTGKVLTEKLLRILKHWSTKLKPNGSILVDASDLPRGPEKIDSTTDKLETYMNIFINHNWSSFLKDIEAMSLKPAFIGSGSSRLWRLQKKGL